ncbi:MAG: hypothetical protein Q8R32_03165, partial [bacterium]|nr:hypothetical protein [bacterium]
MTKRSGKVTSLRSSASTGREDRLGPPPSAPPPVAALTTKEGERRYFTPIRDAIALPHLISSQLESYQSFLREGLQELFDEFNPIEGYGGAMRL